MAYLLFIMRRFSTKLLLSPHQYFVTKGKGPERPYTGDYWWVKDVGSYHCIVCDSKIILAKKAKIGLLQKLTCYMVHMYM